MAMRVQDRQEQMNVAGLAVADVEGRIRRALPALDRVSAAELARVMVRLVAALDPERIYVFGSQARGEARADSDIDVLIVVARADEPAYRLAQGAYCAAGSHTLDLDILVMPLQEFEVRSRAVASLPATVLREGQALYGAA